MSTGKTTNLSKIHRSILFKNQDLWMSIGKTTAWPDENNPPTENEDTTDLSEIKGFKIILTKSLCYPTSSNPDVTVLSQGYKLVSDTEAYNHQNANNIYLFCQIMETELIETPTYYYRQIGIWSKLRPIATKQTKFLLNNSEVEDRGILEYLSNFIKIERRSDRKDNFKFIITIN